MVENLTVTCRRRFAHFINRVYTHLKTLTNIDRNSSVTYVRNEKIKTKKEIFLHLKTNNRSMKLNNDEVIECQ